MATNYVQKCHYEADSHLLLKLTLASQSSGIKDGRKCDKKMKRRLVEKN